MSVSKEYCEKCQECQTNAIHALRELIEERFAGLQRNFIVGSAVLGVIISIIEIAGRIA